jgi:hypothetical protein
MGRTLEDFFVHGKKHNCLSNRTFTRIGGVLYEQTATDWTLVSSPTFQDIVSGKVQSKPFGQHLPDHAKVGILGGMRPRDVFSREREESMTNQNFMANTVAERRLSTRPAKRTQLQLSELAVSGHMFKVGNLALEAAVVEKWIMLGHQEPQVEMARVMEIDRLVKGSAIAASFVCRIINHLFEPAAAMDPNTYEFTSRTLQEMNHMQLGDVFRNARPVRMAITDISRAFKQVQATLPHVKYVYFNNDLKWKFVDRDFKAVQVDGIIPDDVLETAVLAAVDRGVLNKWLNPAA